VLATVGYFASQGKRFALINMAQQVNLAAPIFLKEKHYLSAKSMGISLLLFVYYFKI
jgi:alpha-L-arabinofuranosidase